MKQLKDYIVNENNFFKNLGIGKEALIKKWLDEHKITNYKINDDFTIDVNRNVYLIEYREEYLPDYIQFGTVAGHFDIRCSKLISLRGCPQKVVLYFACCGCPNLTSLEGAPKEVGGDFDCSFCSKLESLKGASQKVDRNFYCYNCGEQFSKDDVKKVSKVKGKLIIR